MVYGALLKKIAGLFYFKSNADLFLEVFIIGKSLQSVPTENCAVILHTERKII